MSSHYTTEPPPTASARLDTTAGPIHLSLFAKQTPLACRNFLQHILDGYYENTVFHRVVPGFILQGGDPTGTGSGGTSIYEDREFETDPTTGEKVVFGDELHSRLHFNRRGLLGMAKTVEGGTGETEYGSQFFITLADCRATLEGKCTLFGRVEGDGIYNVVKIAEGENAEGTDRPVYPFKITGGEVLQLPKGDIWQSMKKRERAATAPSGPGGVDGKPAKRKVRKKVGKTLLSFAEEGEDGDGGLAPALVSKKPKFNTTLVEDRGSLVQSTKPAPQKQEQSPSRGSRPPAPQNPPSKPHRRKPSTSPSPSPIAPRPRKPSFHEPSTQFPPPDPESPSQSPPPSSLSPSPSPPLPHHKKSTLSTTNAEIAALKASMRRDIAPSTSEPKAPKSALESMIPATSIKGRKRKRPGMGAIDTGSGGDSAALKMLNAFKARLDSAATTAAAANAAGDKADHPKDDAAFRGKNGAANGTSAAQPPPPKTTTVAKDATTTNDMDTDEAPLCDLHFIANCLSCTQHDSNNPNNLNPNSNSPNEKPDNNEDQDDANWLSHTLSFAKDRLGKDLTWKRKNEEELVVIDPRERERDIVGEKGKGKGKGKGGGGDRRRGRGRDG
ncbi:MAG: hypothetical protein Q9160_004096 [Pyrenula sp. 1 TL-2023]